MNHEVQVRFGIILSTRRTPGETDTEVLARSLALATCAEQLGIDDLWVTEHHFHPSIVSSSALALASFLLGRTRRVHVGTAVTLLPLHSPVHVAEQGALLDQLSEGRFMLGVGRGTPSADYEAIGRGIDHWHGGLAESLDLTLAAWKGAVGASSDLYAFRAVTPTPTPLTRCGPPLYVAAGSPATIEHAASRGLPMLLNFDKSAETKAEMVAMHAKFAESAGKRGDGHRHASTLLTHVTESPSHVRDLMLARARQLLEGAERPPLLIDAPEPDTHPLDESRISVVADRLLATQPVGDVPTCVRQLVHEIRTTGCTRILFHVEFAEDPGDVHRSLHLLTSEVLPQVRLRLRATSTVEREDRLA